MEMGCVKGIHHQFTAVMFTATLKIMDTMRQKNHHKSNMFVQVLQEGQLKKSQLVLTKTKTTAGKLVSGSSVS